ncbi:MAG: HEAT repeat domain-containing protein [Candidatus Nealsonbacteria bacterium]|nr:HEAT repeat domain-containing protein [Candidatus Nealsonbacteria bacterium]
MYRTRLGRWALTIACLCLLQTSQTLTALADDAPPPPRIVPDVAKLGASSADVRAQEAERLADASAKNLSTILPELLTALADPDVRVRRHVADVLTRIEDRRAVTALLVALDDKDTEVRQGVAIALGRPGLTDAVEPLMKVLRSDESPFVQAIAASELGDIGSPKAVPLLVEILASPRRGVWTRECAARALGNFREEPVFEPLVAALKDDQADVREAAAEGLGRLRDPRAADVLIAALKDKDPDVRESAAGAMGAVRNEKTLPALIAAMQNHDAAESRAAASALSQYGPDAVEPLIAVLNSKNTVLAQKAASSLGAIGDERAVAPLTAALKNPRQQVRNAAAKALYRLNAPSPYHPTGGDAARSYPVPQEVRAQIELLASDDAKTRAAAALALGRLGGPDSLKPLLAAAGDADRLVQRHAMDGLILSLEVSRDPRAVEPLLAMLNNPRFPIDEVARALGKTKDKRAVEPLIAAMTGRMDHRPWMLAYALGDLGDPRAIEPLIQLLDHPHSTSRVAAVRSLIQLDAGHRGYAAITRLFQSEGPYASMRDLAVVELAKVGQPAVAALTDALADENATVRDSAVATLRKIYGHGFDDGGKEWLIWRRQLLGELADQDRAEPAEVASTAETRRRNLVEAARFGVPEQVQAGRFLAFPDRVIASVQYRTGETSFPKPSPFRRQARPTAQPVIKSALAAWTLDGKLLWRTDLPLAYHLVAAGNQLVLAYDGGGLHSQRGLIWVDASDGKEIRRVSLPGRPSKVAFNPRSESLIIVFYPQRRLTVIDEETWMEVRSYQMDGTPAWKHSEPVSELTGIRLDATAVVIGSTAGKEPFVAGLDPLTGKSLWRRGWGRFPSVPELGTPRPKNLKGLACIPKTEGLEFLDPATGATLHALPRPNAQRLMPKFCEHADRVYYTSMQLEGFTLAAQAFPAGNVLWSDCTGTVSYAAPAAWGQDTVFLCQRLSGGLTGHGVVTELRVYSPTGELLSKITKQRVDADGKETGEGYFSTAIATPVGERLYVVDSDGLAALRWE